MTDDFEVCFPRGNGKHIKKLKENTKRKKRHAVPQEVKNEDRDDENPLNDDIDDDELLDMIAKLKENEIHKSTIHYLTMKNIQKNMLVLGYIADIKVDCMLVSLPNSLQGVVSFTNISPKHTTLFEDEKVFQNKASKCMEDFFDVGQLVVCSVLDVCTASQEIKLSLDPKVVNSKYEQSKLCHGLHICGYVKSIEDHGYIIDVGYDNINAFAPFSKQGKQTKLKQFQFVRCIIIESKNEGRILVVSFDPKLLIKPLINRVIDDNSVNSLFPGTLVRFVKKQLKPGGQLGRVGDYIGSLSVAHSSLQKSDGSDDKLFLEEEEHTPKQENKKQYTNTKMLDMVPAKKKKKDEKKSDMNDSKSKLACVLYTMHNSVVLCTNSQMWKDNQRTRMQLDFKEKYPVGQKYNSSVLDKVPDLGIVCQLHKNGPCGIVRIEEISDDSPLEAAEEITCGSLLKVRITKNQSLDGTLEVSSKRSVYDAPYLSCDDVFPGDEVQAKVSEINNKFGLKVVLGTHQGKKFLTSPVCAVVPPFHMSNISLKHPEKVFKLGKVLNCRVLTVNHKDQLITLTNKQAMVQSDLPIVRDYEQLNIGDIVHVYIKLIKPQGCIVGLYNNMKGFVPKTEIKLPNLNCSIKDEYMPGQVVRARVCGCDPAEDKLIMSFLLRNKNDFIS